MADRSPEPADDREWTLETVPFYLGAARLIDPTRPSANNGELTVVVPKSRLESAMAAADERERALTKVLVEALRVAHKGHVATEHLRDCDLAGTHDADAAIVLDFLNAHDALFRKPLPVSVEAEPEAVETATKAAEAFVSDWEADRAESDGRTDAD